MPLYGQTSHPYSMGEMKIILCYARVTIEISETRLTPNELVLLPYKLVLAYMRLGGNSHRVKSVGL